MNKQIIDLTRKVSNTFGFELAVMLAFIEVETGGKGFDPATGKIMIQFEPSWFKKQSPFAPSGIWSMNRVDVQSKEWLAFNDAFSKDKDGAMESTSIGLGQIMGLHWKRLGYKSVGEMWDFAKQSLEQQIWQIAKFIDTDNALKAAIVKKDWTKIATIYNGAGFKELAKKYGREPYDISMKEAYEKYLKAV